MTLFLIQTSVILLVTFCFGWLAGKVGQPRAVGEIVAGIVLGPSLLGRLFPHLFATLFPRGSLVPFEVLSTTGLVLFLFIIGTEVDLHQLKHSRAAAMIVSGASILVPFSIGMLLAAFLRARFAPLSINSGAFVLFVGISMSITAFPVLGRILEERNSWALHWAHWHLFVPPSTT